MNQSTTLSPNFGHGVDPEDLLDMLCRPELPVGQSQLVEIDTGAILSSPAMAQAAEEWARRFRALQVKPATPVLIPMRNDLTSVGLLLGASLAGLFAILIKPTTPAAIRLETLRHAGGGLMIVPNSAAASYIARDMQSRMTLPGDLTMLGTHDTGPGHHTQMPVLGILSSGTTGRSKVIVQPFSNVIRNAQMHVDSIGVHGSDRIALNLPFYYSYGLVAGLFGTLLSGATGLLVDTHRVNPLRALRDIPLSVGMTTPGSARATYGAGLLKGLRILTVGGDYLHHPQACQLMEDAPTAQIFSTYGLSEAGPRVASSLLDQELLDHYRAVPLGAPLKDVHLSFAATDGELLVQSPTTMLEYLNDPAQTQTVFGPNPNTVRTGDVFLRRDHHYFFASRKRRLIVRAGENLYPPYIEAKLLQHLDLTDVWVTGEPDPVLGQQAAAFVVAPEPLDFARIARQLRRHMPAAQIPTIWHQVDALPDQARK